MTSYSGYVCSPVMYPMLAQDKGDISNRLKCSGAQFMNRLQGTAEMAAVGGATFVAAKAVSKTPGVVSAISKGINKVLSKLPQVDIVKKLAGASGKAKALGLVLGLGAIALSYIAGKTLYKAGQIDQKYTDKAAIEEKARDMTEIYV